MYSIAYDSEEEDKDQETTPAAVYSRMQYLVKHSNLTQKLNIQNIEFRYL